MSTPPDDLQAASPRQVASLESLCSRQLLAAAGIRRFVPADAAAGDVLAPGRSLDERLFVERCYSLRLARPADLDALVLLESACWPAPLRCSQARLAARIERYPAGQVVLERDGQVAGAIYSQLLPDAGLVHNRSMHNVEELHADDGKIVQLLAANVLPEFQQGTFGHELLEFALQLSAARGVARVIAVTRCRDFAPGGKLSLAAYIRQCDDYGRPIDPILRFHASHGATIAGVMAGYRPDDHENSGCGVLVEYDLTARRSTWHKTVTRDAGDTPVTSPDVERLVNEAVLQLLGPARAHRFDRLRPLFEQGIDSLDLLSLRPLLKQAFGVEIETTFFFEHPTPQAIAEFFSKTFPAQSGRADPQSGACTAESRAGTGPIAIVGMACRFPGAASVDEFWRLLRSGEDAVGPQTRWRDQDLTQFEPELQTVLEGQSAGLLDEIAQFDAAFFNIAPREAELMDPQQRLVLEVAWEALEHAAISADGLRGTATGVFIGASGHDYDLLRARCAATVQGEPWGATGGANSVIAGRVAYAFGLQGPVLTIDTACSSSLTAVHLACQSLRTGEANVALAGGVNLLIAPDVSAAYTRAGMLSPTGCCRTFDAQADGYARGEGCGVVVLKRLSDAQRDGDRVLAVIRGSAVKHDGASNGLTAPSAPAQRELIESALAQAGVLPADVGYLEAHGTGTRLGDPVEASAAAAALTVGRTMQRPLLLGSVKTNIGHLEAAAGIAGLIKVVLSMEHGVIPPQLHFMEPNANIAWDRLALQVVREPTTWQKVGSSVAGVSSFGISGTGAHVIVDAAPEPVVNSVCPSQDGDPDRQVLFLSARTSAALAALAGRYRRWLEDHPQASLADVCYTARVGRSRMPVSARFSAGSIDEAIHRLRTLEAGGAPDGDGIGSDGACDEDRRADAVRFRKIALPTYPFQRQRYWLPERVTAAPASLDWTYQVVWRSKNERLIPDRGDPERSDLRGHTLHSLAELEVAATRMARDTVAQIREAEVDPCQTRLWRRLKSMAVNSSPPVQSTDVDLKPSSATPRWQQAALELVERCGRSLPDVLRGQPALPLLFPADGSTSAGDVYEHASQNQLVARVLQELTETHRGQPGIRILEVGAGTGSTTRAVLDRLGSRQFQYTFTDLSAAFLAPAEQRLAGVSGLNYRTLDIERSPVEQGFAAESFDVVIAANVLHATRDLDATLDHVHRLLAPGGRLVLIEHTQPHRWLDVTFGLLSGWWRFNDKYRDDHPLLPIDRWHALLRQKGFAGVESSDPAGDGQFVISAVREAAPRTWVIDADESTGKESALRLAQELQRRGQTVIDARNSAAADRGVQVVYLCHADGPLDEETPESAEQRLGQVLKRTQCCIARGQRLWIVTGGGQAVSDGQLVSPGMSAVWGFGRTLRLEHPGAFGGLIDLPHDGNPLGLVDALLSGDDEEEVALRGGVRHVARLVRAEPQTGDSLSLNPAGTYLVTGGFGTIGQAVSLWLAEQGARNLVLTTRADADLLAPARRDFMHRLARRGVRVMAVTCDPSQRSDVALLFERLAVLPQLAGIIHAAGGLDTRPVDSLTEDDLRTALTAKLHGGWWLERYSRNGTLDFFVCCSSGASIWGGAGQAAYGAANAFLDGLCHARRAAGLPAVSINWGLWTAGGAAASRRAEFERAGLRGMPAAAALRLLAAVIDSGVAQRTIASVDWPAFGSLYNARRRHPLLDEIIEHSAGEVAGPAVSDYSKRGIGFPFKTGQSPPARQSAGETIAALPPEQRLSALQRLALEQFATVTRLEMAGIDARTGLFDLGMDSMMAIEFRRRLEEQLGLKLPVTLAIDAPNLAAVAAFLDRAIGNQTPQDKQDELHSGGGSPAICAAVETEQPATRAPSGLEPIAIIGMACRFPGARSTDQYWKLLDAGNHAIGEITADRWDVDTWFDDRPETPHKMHSRYAGLLEDLSGFDPEFFRISPREAATIDPQHRLLLEVAWEALEDAGIPADSLHGSSSGVFVGITSDEFRTLLQDCPEFASHVVSGSPLNAAAGRLSYTFGLRGPAQAIDTACSSGLVAVHNALLSLRAGDCDLALAGGVNAIIRPEPMVALCKSGIVSPGSRCRPFDAAADGVVRGEGCGVVVLKRLSDALRDGDRIDGVIRGSAVNHDGASSGLTVPNGDAQQALIRRALSAGNLQPRDVAYVEAHGTGTRLGDPVEVQALGAAYGTDRSMASPLLIGSVKANIGHLESAAGIAGLIKVVLAQKAGRIPQQLWFETPNPGIPWAALPVKVVDAARAWPAGRRIAGVSSFGASGTNAHVLLEAVSLPDDDARSGRDEVASPHLLVLSATSEVALREIASRFAAWLEQHPDANLPDVCFTAAAGRVHFNERAAMIGRSHGQLLAQLMDLANGSPQRFIGSTDPATIDARLRDVTSRYLAGETVDFRGLFGVGRKKLSLPTYAFQRNRYWPVELKRPAAKPAALARPVVQDVAASSPARRIVLMDSESVVAGRTETATSRPVVRLSPLHDVADRSQSAGKFAPAEFADARPQVPALSQARSTVLESVRAAGDLPAEETHIADLFDTTTTVRALLAKTLYLDVSRVQDDRPFLEMGLDSILGVEFTKLVNGQFGLQLKATAVYDHPTVDDFSTFISGLVANASPAGTPSTMLGNRSPAVTGTLDAEPPATATDAVAVIGIACRFPGADDWPQFWQNICSGVDSITEAAPDRWPEGDWLKPDPEHPERVTTRWGGFIDRVDEFDAAFFGISPAEAISMDPQQRIFLEVAYHALEDARVAGSSLKGSQCGVFVGAAAGDYHQAAGRVANRLELTGSLASMLPARIAYALDLRGPVLAIDTACSSSLVAIHEACESLRHGRSTLALAGGITLMHTPATQLLTSRFAMNSPTGRCRTFSASADGVVWSEGCGVVVLKPLARAVEDGDHIYAVVRASGVNYDGATNGITAPSADSQADLQREVYERFHVAPATIGYIEAHGTGTNLGDPIEIEALKRVFSNGKSSGRSCALGSVKTNIGHAQLAAGVASFIKAALAVERGQLPPSLHFAGLNPHVDLHDSPFFVNTELCDWPGQDGRRRAAVSSFGMSGTNAHVVLESYDSSVPQVEASAPGRLEPLLFVLSAKSTDALRELAARYADLCRGAPRQALADLCHAARVSRTHFAHRAAVVFSTCEQAVELLGGVARGECPHNVFTGEVRGRVADRRERNVAGDDAPAALARQYVSGAPLDFLTAGGARGRRVALPKYPFQRKRFRMPDRDPAADNAPQSVPVSLGSESAPGILWQQLATGEICGTWQLSLEHCPWLADHQLFGTPVLPAATYVALALTSGLDLQELQDLVIRLPLAIPVDQPVNVQILIGEPGDAGERSFRCFSRVQGAGSWALNAQGWLCKGRPLDTPAARSPVTTKLDPVRPLVQLEGLGDSFGSLQTVRGDKSRSIAEVQVPARLRAALGETRAAVLTAVDAAAQVCGLYLSAGQAGDRSLYLPFHYTRVRIQGEVPSRFSLEAVEIRREPGSQPGADLPYCADVRMMADDGRVFGVIDGLSGRRLTSAAWSAGRPADHAVTETSGFRQNVEDAPAFARPEMSTAVATDPSAAVPRRVDGSARHAELKQAIEDELCRLLMLEERPAGHAGFFDLGMDSLMAVDLATRLEKRLGAGVRLPATVLFDYPTIDTLTGRLCELLSNPDGPAPARPVVAEPLAIVTGGRDSPATVQAAGSVTELPRTPQPVQTPVDVGIDRSSSPAAPLVTSAERSGPSVQPKLSPDDNADSAIKSTDAIAVVGLACRFPGAADADQFWNLLVSGVDAISDVPEGRWGDGWFDADRHAAGKVYTRQGGFLADIDRFDAKFFGISPREAASLDPQQRLLLEVAWQALEYAGIAASALRGSDAGVFVGISTSDYDRLVLQQGPGAIDGYYGTGNTHSAAAGRISHFFGLHGPALAIDTACSSSLVAVHQACRALHGGECNLAIVGGVNALIGPELSVQACRAGMLSADGRCRGFDASAGGYGRAEGCGVVILKRMADAVRDNDRVLAVIRGSAVNQDGASSGLTVPHGPSQQRVIASALQRAGVAPGDVNYLEAHGTGTQLGDPIELEAAAAALGQGRRGDRPLLIGSVKSNIGHLEAAAGIAGLIKVVLSLHHGITPPHLHFDSPNPHVDWGRLGLNVVHEAVPWPVETTRLAGVSSFGFTGTNAHVVVQGADPCFVGQPATDRSHHLLLLSARSAAALRVLAEQWKAWLAGHSEVRLADVCYTAATGREHWPHRAALVVDANQPGELTRLLTALGQSNPAEGLWQGHVPAEAGTAGSAARVLMQAPGLPLPARLTALAELYVLGQTPDFRLLDWSSRQKVAIPGYPFERQRFWATDLRQAHRSLEMAPVLETQPTEQPSERPASRAPAEPKPAARLSDERIASIRDTLRQLLAGALFVELSEINNARAFTEQGLDSILGVEFTNAVNRHFQLHLKSTTVYEHPTVERLARRLAALIPLPDETRTGVASEESHTSAVLKTPRAAEEVSGQVAAPADTVPGASAAQRQASRASLPATGRSESIAIIGMACRFPGADNYREFWANLAGGVDSVTQAPLDRWPDTPGVSRAGGFVSNVDRFDAEFFGISPAEAEYMDPQQRIFLEEAWHAVEDACCSPDKLAGSRCGVFAGLAAGDYDRLLADSDRNRFRLTGGLASMLPARIAYALDLRGPAVAIDTACSSSLVAVHEACESIRRGECDLAIAGGITLMHMPHSQVLAGEFSMNSPTARCRAFDAAADGVVWSEGCGVVFLKGLDQALRDGDPIHAVLLGSGVNHDGASNGITAPSAQSQLDLGRSVHERFQIDPGSIGYVETHGTGTRLGDPIEFDALSRLIPLQSAGSGHCGIGSVKTNIGHTAFAAGIAGLIKAALCLREQMLVPSLHFHEANPHIEFEGTALRVVRERAVWTSDRARRAAVSSFGLAGTNAHAVLEEPPALTKSARPSGSRCNVLLLSARTDAALADLVARYRSWLVDHPACDLSDLCYSAIVGRRHFARRLALTFDSADDLLRQLDRCAALGIDQSLRAGPGPNAAGGLPAAALAYLRGATPHAELLFPDGPRIKVRLPEYPFERERYWAPVASPSVTAASEDPFPGDRHESPWGEVAFTRTIDPQAWPWLNDHRLFQVVTAPGSLLLSMALTAAPDQAFCDVSIQQPLTFPGGGREVQVVFRPASSDQGGDGREFSVVSRERSPGSPWQTHLCGRCVPIAGGTGPTPISVESPDKVRVRLVEVDVHEALRSITATGITLGPALRGLARLWASDDEGLSQIEIPGITAPIDDALIHPVGLDACLQTAVVAILGRNVHVAYVPVGVDRIEIHRKAPRRIICHVRLKKKFAPGDAAIRADLTLFDESGQVFGSVYGFVARRTERRQVLAATSSSSRPIDDWFYRIERHELPLNDAVDPGGGLAVASLADGPAADLPTATEIASARQVQSTFHEICCCSIRDGLRELGLALSPDSVVLVEQVMAQGVIARHRRLVARLLEILREGGWIDSEGRWRGNDTARTFAELRQDLLAAWPDCDSELTVLARCSSQLAGVLRGSVEPLTLLFPAEGVRADDLYHASPTMKSVHRRVAEAVRAALRSRPDTHHLQILEIGAGTGGATAQIVPLLPAGRTTYVFSDVSGAFLASAERRFSGTPGVQFRTLDIERDPAVQGFVGQRFDLVIASNVLHATRDLEQALQNVRSLLATGGLLIVAEGVSRQPRADLTFGMLDGWWRFDDSLRSTYPLLDVDQWKSLLVAQGFVPLQAAAVDAGYEQALFVATVDNRAPAACAPLSWTIVSNDRAAAAALAGCITARGGTATVDSGDDGRDFDGLDSSGGVVFVADQRDVDCSETASAADDGLPERAESDCRTALRLAQSLIARKLAPPRGVWFVTAGDASQDPQRYLAHALLWGLARTLSVEHPELGARTVGLTNLRDLNPVVDELYRTASPCEASRIEDQILLEGGRRFVPRLVPARLESHGGTHGPIRSGATYLVTGGTGGLGLATARWLAAEGADQIVLNGRSPGNDAADLVEELRERGVTVRVIPGDVADERDVRRLLNEIDESLPPLVGIFHSAGVLCDVAIGDAAWERFAEVLAPKLRGAWQLHRLTQDRELELFVVYSSTASITGNVGQANHAAANLFLDRLAEVRRQAGLPVTCINWGPWSEIGAAARCDADGRISRQLDAAGVGWIAPERGLQALGRVLASGSAQTIVLPVDWTRLVRQFAGRTPGVFAEVLRQCGAGIAADAANPPAAVRLPVETAAVSAQVPDTADLAGFVARCVSDLLRLRGPLQSNASFFDLGMDSLMAVELRNRLGAVLRVDPPLSATVVFDHPTLEGLVSHLLLREAAVADASPKQPGPSSTGSAKVVGRSATADPDEIAVVGMACRFPGARDLGAFQQLLFDARDAIGQVPPDRWDIDAWYDPDPRAAGRMVSRCGGFVDDVAMFDAEFFGISPREAISMDPQQRLVLEIAWEALEHAGIAPAQLRGSRTGVFMGVSEVDYGRRSLAALDALDFYAGTGFSQSFVAGRLSHSLGLQGPSQVVDTVCSSSLVSLHQACQSLRSGECEAALAGGVHLMLSPTGSVFLSRTQALSPDGRCRTFDASANGFGRAEGCGVLVLKRLRDAQRDRNRIWAVVRGSSVNHDGSSGGLTMPSGPAQERVIREALERSQIAAADVDYLEAHGTGTSLGDPIEVQAAMAVLGEGRPADRPLLIGSVKSNIGHAEAAAGVAGLIKVIVAMHAGRIPPHLHFTHPNPHIPWERLKVRVATQAEAWPDDKRLIAGVSAFGLSGTNAHVLLESSPRPEPANSPPPMPAATTCLLVLSARTAPALRALAGRYREWCEQHPVADWRDVCCTAARGRSHFEHRAALLADSVATARELLQSLENGDAAGVLVSHRRDDLPGAAGSFASGNYGAEDLVRAARSYVDGDDSPLARVFSTPCLPVDLPAYPFQRKRYWIDAPPEPARAGPQATDAKATTARSEAVSTHPLLGRRESLAGIEGSRFEREFRPDELQWLAEHRVRGQVIYPAAGFVEMIASLFPVPCAVDQVRCESPLLLDRPCRLQTVVANESPGQISFYSRSADDAAWQRHATAIVREAEDEPHAEDLAAIAARCTSPVDLAGLDRRQHDRGLECGPAWRAIQWLRTGDSELSAELKLPGGLDLESMRLHPSLVDSALRTLAALFDIEDGTLFLPVGIDRIEVWRAAGRSARVYARADRSVSGNRRRADVLLLAPDGSALARLTGVTFQRAGSLALSDAGPKPAASSQPNGMNLLARLQPQTDRGRRRLLESHLRHEVQTLLNLDDVPPVDAAFANLGMDSMVSVELHERLQSEFGGQLQLPRSIVLEFPTVAQLRDYLLGQLNGNTGSAETAPAAGSRIEPAGDSPVLEDVAALNDAEVAALLDKEIDAVLGGDHERS